MWEYAYQRGLGLDGKAVILGDGAVWIDGFGEGQYCRNWVRVVDWYHAEEHLETVARAAFSAPQQAQTRLSDNKQVPWEGEVEAVIFACRALAEDCAEAARNAGSFSTNAERMRYGRFRTLGLMSGNGGIESRCKQIVTQRLKLPGARWLVEGAIQTAKARAAWLSGQRYSLYQKRATSSLAI